MILSTHLLALLAIYSPIIVESSLHLRSQTIDLDPPKLSHDGMPMRALRIFLQFRDLSLTVLSLSLVEKPLRVR